MLVAVLPSRRIGVLLRLVPLLPRFGGPPVVFGRGPACRPGAAFYRAPAFDDASMRRAPFVVLLFSSVPFVFFTQAFAGCVVVVVLPWLVALFKLSTF